MVEISKTYYAQQAILIGCTYGDSTESITPLIDARRMRNYLKNQFNYECRLLENPSYNDIILAIKSARQQMTFVNRDCRLLIYFSGVATRFDLPVKLSENKLEEYADFYTVACHLSEIETIDLREEIKRMDDEENDEQEAKFFVEQEEECKKNGKDFDPV